MIAPTRERTERLLEKSGRITPREVLEAYQETGFEPRTGNFVSGNRACAIGALGTQCGYEHIGDMPEDVLKDWPGRPGEAYLWGFTDGFDGNLCRSPYDEQGYLDGQRARTFVEHYIGFSGE